MDIIRGILGEAEDQDEKKKKKPEAEEKPPKAERPEPKSARGESPEDSAIDELANLWRTGNHDEVTRRFIGMDSQTAVKLVFAIGREDALELARMVDDMLEQEAGSGEFEAPPEGEEGPSGEISTEPMSVEPAGRERDIAGGEHVDMQDYAKSILGIH